MQKIPLGLAKPGMKLAKPAVKEGGMVIAAQGMEITERLIERLENMNVDSVVVEGNPLDPSAGEDTPFARIAGRLDHLFRRYGEDKVMMQVKQALQGYFQMKAAHLAAMREAEKAKAEAAAAPAAPEAPNGKTASAKGRG